MCAKFFFLHFSSVDARSGQSKPLKSKKKSKHTDSNDLRLNVKQRSQLHFTWKSIIYTTLELQKGMATLDSNYGHWNSGYGRYEKRVGNEGNECHASFCSICLICPGTQIAIVLFYLFYGMCLLLALICNFNKQCLS